MKLVLNKKLPSDLVKRYNNLNIKQRGMFRKGFTEVRGLQEALSKSEEGDFEPLVDYFISDWVLKLECMAYVFLDILERADTLEERVNDLLNIPLKNHYSKTQMGYKSLIEEYADDLQETFMLIKEGKKLPENTRRLFFKGFCAGREMAAGTDSIRKKLLEDEVLETFKHFIFINYLKIGSGRRGYIPEWESKGGEWCLEYIEKKPWISKSQLTQDLYNWLTMEKQSHLFPPNFEAVKKGVTRMEKRGLKIPNKRVIKP